MYTIWESVPSGSIAGNPTDSAGEAFTWTADCPIGASVSWPLQTVIEPAKRFPSLLDFVKVKLAPEDVAVFQNTATLWSSVELVQLDVS